VYPAVINHEKETHYLRRLAVEHFGEDKVKEEGLPLMGAEDFSYYL